MAKNIDLWTIGALQKNTIGNYCNDNTVVKISAVSKSVELFGNCIYMYNIVEGCALFSLAEHNTQTTRARLNAILEKYNISLQCRGGVVYASGEGFTNQKINPDLWYEIGAGALFGAGSYK